MHSYLLHIVTNSVGIRQQSTALNRPSFEEGSAEQLFAREQNIPPENDVNALFSRMLVSFHLKMLPKYLQLY